MKKRVSLIACIALTAALIFSMMGFAAANTAYASKNNGFTITETSPADGSKGNTKDNVCLKIFFSKDVGDKVCAVANEDMFGLKDAEGNEIPTRIYYSTENAKYAIIAVDTTKRGSTIEGNSDYTFYISKDFVDNDGDRLGEDYNVAFKTLNQKRSTGIYMVLMIAMFAAMFVFSMKSNRKSKEEESGVADKYLTETFNPYKEAKRTGKSLAEVIAIHEKEEERAAAKAAKKANKNAKPEDIIRNIGNTYFVKRPHPISEAGSTYKTGRGEIAKAEAARKAAEKAARKANNYGKGNKKKSNKK